MNRSLVLILAIVLVLFPLAVLRADVLSVGSTLSAIGDSFSLPVSISGASDLYAFEFDLTFDPSILQLQSITEGSFLATAGSTFFIPGMIDNVAGTATFTADTLLGPGPGAASSGTLAALGFAAVAAGSTTISLSNVILLDSNLDNIAFTNTPGSVTVSGTAVPEPDTLILVAAGFLLLGGSILRRHIRSHGGQPE